MTKRIVTFRVEESDWEGFKRVAEFFDLSPSELLRCEVASVQSATLLKFEGANVLHLASVRIPALGVSS